MSDLDTSIEVFGEAGSYFTDNPVLTKGSLNEYPGRNEQE